MVFALMVATVFLLIAVDYFVRREERGLKDTGDQRRTPIFLAPDKALLPVETAPERAFHLSHTWMQPTGNDEGLVYIGFDELISQIMNNGVTIKNLPLKGAILPQGAPVWRIHMGQRYLEQLSPVSGKVVDVNPACQAGMPLPSEKIEKSWVLKFRADHFERENHNLMSLEQAHLLNRSLLDELYLLAQRGEYLNDGGKIDPEFIIKMDPSEWAKIVKRFFPYQKTT